MACTGRLEIGDMAARVARHVEHLELERGLADTHARAARERLADLGDVLARRPVDGHRAGVGGMREQLGHTADVVGMVVGE